MPLTIKKRGQVWHYSGTVAGRRLRGSTGTADKKLAERIAAEKEHRQWQRRLDGPGAGLTMAQAFISYLDAGKSDRFIDKIAAYWRDTPVSDVTAGAIRQAAMTLYPNASNATRNRQVIVPTVAAINHCAELEWCSRIKVKRFKVTTKPKDFATAEWVAAFEAHASPHLGALCRFMFETGARVGEAVALTWADIDMHDKTARIRQTKVSVERDARLTPNALVALANIPSNRNPEERVFGYLGRDSVAQPWNAAVKRAGIQKLNRHSCRHGFATAMLRAGIDAKTVAKWGGWKDVRVLLETYAHAIDDPSVVDDVFGTKLTHDKSVSPVRYSKIKEKQA